VGDVGVVEIDDWEDVWMMMIISMMIIIILIIIHLFIVHLMVVLGFLRARKSSFVEELESARVPEDVGSVHRLFEKRRFRNSNV
jgi:sensor domain CHASE-containing protein